MTVEELVKLLDAARRRPLAEAQTIRRGPRAGLPAASIGSEARARLTAVGQERALIYATLLATGLRKRELSSITVGQCMLDGENPRLCLAARNVKSRKAAVVPLRGDLARAIGQWLQERLEARQRAAAAVGEAMPESLPHDERLFNVARALHKLFARDLAFAGTPKVDARGRRLDVHCLSMTCGTMMQGAGVAPRTAQAVLRHSDIRLTTAIHTDESRLPQREAVEALPDLPLVVPRLLPAPGVLAPTPDLPGHFGGAPDTSGGARW